MTIHLDNISRNGNNGQNKVRLVDTATMTFLHLSGEGTTKDVKKSWLGTRTQADNLYLDAVFSGEPWPFKPVHRDIVDAGKMAVIDAEMEAQDD